MDSSQRLFERSVEIVFEHEGGYVCDPDDPGGETNFGISKRTYPGLGIQSLTKEEAKQIYYTDWWQRYGYYRIEYAPLQEKLLDLAVNMGPANAHRLIQRAIALTTRKPIVIDGIMGPDTRQAINLHPEPQLLLCKFELLAIEHYLKLNKPKFLAGWVRRVLS